jgi:leader peptidase (prepilin peptidase)/N-methyltransferase
VDTGFVYLDILPSWFGALAVTLFGLAIGSFLNVVIYRIPLMLEYYDSLASDSPDLAEQAGTATEAREREHISLLQPRRSFCPNCQRQITAMENIPVFSYLLLGGKCRGCQLPISWIYPFVELLTAGAFVGAFFKQLALPEFSIPWLFADLIFIALNISLIFIDYNHMILPDVLTYPGLLLAVAFRWLVPQPAYMESGFFAVQICLILLMMLAILGSLVKWGHSQRFKVALLIGLIGFIGFASYQLLHFCVVAAGVCRAARHGLGV